MWCCAPCSDRDMCKPQDRSRWPLRCRQQFGTQPILISTPQWPHRPCNAPTWLYRVGKKLSVKADLAIYSQVVDASAQCMSVSLILGFNLDFSSYHSLVGFCKSSHILILLLLLFFLQLINFIKNCFNRVFEYYTRENLRYSSTQTWHSHACVSTVLYLFLSAFASWLRVH